MTNLLAFQSKWQKLKATMSPAELKHQQDLIDEAHNEAKAILLGNPPAKVNSITDLAMVKTALGEADIPLTALNTSNAAAYVDNLGQIWGFRTYEQLDLGWVASLVYYNEYKNKKGSFGGDAQVIPIPNDAKIAIAGDWGTGYWRGADTPAAKVAALMTAAKPDYTIHIGDTYYAGTQDEMNNNLLNIWPKGKSGSFAIPGNHEMYCGDNFYNAILPTLCPLQNGVSYFALQNDNWLIICLDTAYYASGDLYMNGSIMDQQSGGEQVKWLMSILPKAGNRKIVIVTHHEPLDLGGSHITNLFGEINTLLMVNNLKLAFWYYGHEHNAAVYSELSAMHYPARCIGHGAIPYGVASDLSTATGTTVTWAETQSANDPSYPNRILNGYLVMELNGAAMTESLYSENGDLRWSQVN
ncbi:MAG TPA: metallophosphoesterase [Bacteroidia bacterium]|nr:metallophosphoesterase [Bacteroidia bacterium]